MEHNKGYEPGDLLDKYYTVGEHLFGYEVLDDDITIDCVGKNASNWEDNQCPRCSGYDTCLLSSKLFKYYSCLDDMLVSGSWHCIDCGLVWQVTNISASYNEPWC